VLCCVVLCCVVLCCVVLCCVVLCCVVLCCVLCCVVLCCVVLCCVGCCVGCWVLCCVVLCCVVLCCVVLCCVVLCCVVLCLVLCFLQVLVAKRMAGMLWAGGVAEHGKLGLNVRSSACVPKPHQLTDLPSQAELQRFMSGVALRTVPFRPKVVVPSDITTLAEPQQGDEPPDAQGHQRQTMAEELAAVQEQHVSATKCGACACERVRSYV